MQDLTQAFEDTVELVKTARGNFTPSNQLKLEMYGLYKQATEGDVHGKKPGMLDVVGKAKYQAWAKLKGTDSTQAMQLYINKVAEIKSDIT
ncbi:acyl-CoA-binding protein [Arenicella xantha]|nr:acyl-CoA-binding protein [Arenicella xantha]